MSDQLSHQSRMSEYLTHVFTNEEIKNMHEILKLQANFNQPTMIDEENTIHNIYFMNENNNNNNNSNNDSKIHDQSQLHFIDCIIEIIESILTGMNPLSQQMKIINSSAADMAGKNENYFYNNEQFSDIGNMGAQGGASIHLNMQNMNSYSKNYNNNHNNNNIINTSSDDDTGIMVGVGLRDMITQMQNTQTGIVPNTIGMGGMGMGMGMAMTQGTQTQDLSIAGSSKRNSEASPFAAEQTKC